MTKIAALLVLSAIESLAQAQTFEVVHNFAGRPTDGSTPYAGLLRDPDGNLYGTTYAGGTHNFGVVFMIDPTRTETVLYSFTGGVDGANPEAGVIQDGRGNLYGTTYSGGSGGGVVFMLNSAGAFTLLHTFASGSDGAYPVAGLVRDGSGNLYGTTSQGGAFGYGIVFELDSSGNETILHSFGNGVDGRTPMTGLIRGEGGALYGTTSAGGTEDCGIAFTLDSAGTETVLYNFQGEFGGQTPNGLMRDQAGNFYGMTSAGGKNGAGVIFRLDSSGTEKVLYNFTGYGDGGVPLGVLARDSSGNLYGTASRNGCCGAGTVFKLDSTGTLTALHSFSGQNGGRPRAGVIWDPSGYLYGTASASLSADGMVFRINTN